jgi:lipoate-protein ligase A
LNEVLLIKKYDHIFSKSTKSHRSTVVNLSDYLAYPITLSDLKNSILDFMFKGNIQEYNLNEEDWKSVHKLATKKYKSWDWNLGLSPKSTIKLKIEDSTKSRIINLKLEHGKMANFSISGFSLSKKLHHTLQELLIGRRFDVEDLREMVSKLEQVQFPQEITNVFRKALTH